MRRNHLSMRRGVASTNIHETMIIMIEPNTKPSKGDSTMNSDRLDQAGRHQYAGSRLGYGRPDQAADQGMRRRGRNAEKPGDEIPEDGADQRAEYHELIDHGRIDGVLADRSGHRQREYQYRDEIEDCRHGDRGMRFQHTRGDDCGNGVGGIMEAVQEIEYERQSNQEGDHVDADL